jgi:hypothetical protein
MKAEALHPSVYSDAAQPKRTSSRKARGQTATRQRHERHRLRFQAYDKHEVSR